MTSISITNTTKAWQGIKQKINERPNVFELGSGVRLRSSERVQGLQGNAVSQKLLTLRKDNKYKKNWYSV